ncbi:MAG: RNA 2',3'-cyclic phosphodiesterase [Candidatus Zixiibacteriota bacterium]
MMRLFIALPLPEPVEEELGRIIDLLKQKGGRVRWVAPENIHLTVRFLGDTEEALVKDLSALIDTVASKYSPVNSVIDRLGGFPNLSRPRVIWVGLRDNIEPLQKMAREIELAVRQLRFPKEKKGFKAHLTLGRVKDASTIKDLSNYMESYEFAEIPLLLDRLVLFKSTLTPQGAIYERLHEAGLGEK